MSEVVAVDPLTCYAVQVRPEYAFEQILALARLRAQSRESRQSVARITGKEPCWLVMDTGMPRRAPKGVTVDA